MASSMDDRCFPFPTRACGDVEGPFVRPYRLAQRHHVVGRGVAGWRDRQAGGQREGAHLHRLGGEALHLAHLVECRGPVLYGPGGDLQRGLAELRRGVDADPVGLQSARPVVQRVPLPRHVGDERLAQVVLEGLRTGLSGREWRVAAVPRDLGRHALVGLALPAGIVEQRDIGVRVHVDEPRRYHVSGGVDPARCLGVAQRADGLDPAVGYPDVGLVAGRAAPVHDGAVQYQGVECHRCPPDGAASRRADAPRRSGPSSSTLCCRCRPACSRGGPSGRRS